MKKKNLIFGIIIGVVLVLIVLMLVLIYFKFKNNSGTHYVDHSDDGPFSTSFIRESHKNMDKSNYMISPYSVELALSMLREGASGDALKELNKVAPERSIKTITVKDKVNVANALFVKEDYKKDVNKNYYKKLKEYYNAEILYDKFEKPTVINNWCNKETNGMIKKIVEQMDPNFVVGIANAIAMEEEWNEAFDCEMTTGYAFTKINGKQYDTSMMFHDFDSNAAYYEYEGTKGVVLPYKTYNRLTGKKVKDDEEGEQLDFVGILPDDIDKFISNLDLDYIKNGPDKAKKANEEYEISVGLPRFSYDYDFDRFKDTLIDMGIKSVFEPSNGLSNMMDNHDDLFIDEALHKSFVKVDEKGTKAAAVTYFGVKNTSMPADKEFVSIVFDKPFVFMIKDHNSNEILFFGVVYEPEKWNGEKSCK